jgi:restriction system protein
VAGNNRSRWGEKAVRHRFHDGLADIDPLEFERLMADYYRSEGYEVIHSGTGRGGSTFDGGVDLRLRKDGRLTLVQCKRKNAHQVTHNVVHELLGVKVNEGATEAIVITTGEFTEAARRAGASGHVKLIDGVELRRLLGSRLERVPSRRTVAESDYLPQWEPLVVAQERPRRRSGRETRKAEGQGKLIAAAAVLVFVALLQVCSRPRQVVSLPASPLGGPGPRMAVTPATPATPQEQLRPSLTSSRAPYGTPSVAAQIRNQPQPPEPSEPPQLSAAEQARRDDATRRYLERVPEITHYRHSPLDQNKEPLPAAPDEDAAQTDRPSD